MNDSLVHIMHLDSIIYDEVDSGLKLVESRLNDSKRQKLRVGDTIIFYKRPENVIKTQVRVFELHKYSSIKDLVNSTPIAYWGPRFKTREDLLNSKWHYSNDEIQKYGLLAIYIQKI